MNQSKRDAQNLASVYSSAVAAGAVELQDQTEIEAKVDLLVNGVYGGGRFDETLFQVPNLSDEEALAAMEHLQLSDGDLAFVSRHGEHGH